MEEQLNINELLEQAHNIYHVLSKKGHCELAIKKFNRSYGIYEATHQYAAGYYRLNNTDCLAIGDTLEKALVEFIKIHTKALNERKETLQSEMSTINKCLNNIQVTHTTTSTPMHDALVESWEEHSKKEEGMDILL